MTAAVTYQSVQMTAVLGTPPGFVAEDAGGKVRALYFELTAGSLGVVGGNGDRVLLAWIPAGVRLLGGFFTSTAGSGATTWTIDRVNPTTLAVETASYYGNLTSTAAINSQNFNNTPAFNFGTLTTLPWILGLTAASATFAAAAVMKGYILIEPA